MERLLVIVLAVVLGGLGFYVYDLKTNGMPSSFLARVQAPTLQSIVQVAENRSANSIIVVKKGLGNDNNAVFLMQWIYKSRVGVDFTGFDWTTLDGVGETYSEEGVLISGELPALEPLGVGEVISEQEKVVSKIALFDEEKNMRPVAKAEQAEVNGCTRDVLLYDPEIIDHAKSAIEQFFSVAAPRDATGEPMVKFDLTFKNEAALRAEITARSNTKVSCGGVVTMDAG
ncbi:MAG: hypothetical protein GYB25_04480 [Rhodobacteraceae bacterium]|nr:hypothetical protein [Paracoccaceae bacterium]